MKKRSIYSKTQRQLRRELVDALSLSRAQQATFEEGPPDVAPIAEAELMDNDTRLSGVNLG